MPFDGRQTAPSTSVIVPVRNGAAFIDECFESVLAQIGRSDELIVIDDASTDETPHLLHQFGDRIVVLNADARGPSAARNVGLRRARGDCVAFLDSDDYWPPGRHCTLVSALIGDPLCNAAVGRLVMLTKAVADDGNHAAWHGQHIPGILGTCLYRRSLIDAVGGFDETLRFSEDNDYFARLREAGLILSLCDVDGLCYRQHSGNMTNAAPSPRVMSMELAKRRLARLRATPSGTQADGTTSGK